MPLSSDLKRIMVQPLSGVSARWLVGPLMFTWSLSGGAATVIDERQDFVGRSGLVSVLVAELLWQPLRSGVVVGMIVNWVPSSP